MIPDSLLLKLLCGAKQMHSVLKWLKHPLTQSTGNPWKKKEKAQLELEVAVDKH